MTQPPRLWLTLVFSAVSGLLWLSLLAFLILLVPRYERTFMVFNMRLPATTVFVIAVARWCVKYWYVAFFAVGMGTVFLGGLTFVLRHAVAIRWLSTVWCLLLIVLPLTTLVVFLLSMLLPLATLHEGLGGAKKG